LTQRYRALGLPFDPDIDPEVIEGWYEAVTLRLPGYPHLNLTMQDMDEIGCDFFFKMLDRLVAHWPKDPNK
jgi:hypothetical protein